MIVDLRTYTLYPGKTAEYLALYEAEGLAIQKRILGNLIGYFTTETGHLNQIVHMWGYRDVADRDARRAVLFQDLGFLTLASKVYPLIQRQENQILKGTSFSPL